MEPVTPRFTANVSSDLNSGLGWKKYIMVGFLVVLGMIFWVWLTSPMVITVTGTGVVSVPATSANINFTLSSSDANVQSAISSVESKAKNVTDILKNSGIPESDISQSQVIAVPSGLVTAGTSGYQANITMGAKTSHVTDLSSLVSSLYNNGAFVVAQPVLSVDNRSVLEQKALDDAMKDADSQALKFGLSKWKFIKKIVSITQVSSGSTSTSTSKADTLTQANSQTAADNGVFKISEAVSVTYKIW